MAYQKPLKITLKNTRFIFNTNFSGALDKFGSTDRYFNVIVDPKESQNSYGRPGDMKPLKIEDLVNDGWNVRFTEEKEDYPSQAFIKVKASYRKRDGSPVKRPPHVIKAIGGPDYKVTLDEESIGDLDSEYIENVEHVDIRGWEYEPGKISAYLVNMYVTVEDDPFTREYVDAPVERADEHLDDDLPF